jgi:hypothetical protein
VPDPQVLGEERHLAAFLADQMRGSGFEAAGLQPVLPDQEASAAARELPADFVRKVALAGNRERAAGQIRVAWPRGPTR